MPNPVSPDRVWRDPEVLEMRRRPRELQMRICGGGEPFCLGTALALVNSIDQVVKHSIPGFKVPFFLAHGTKDYGVKIEGSEFMFEIAATADEDKEYHRLDGAYHDLFSLKESHDYLKKAVAWIEKRCEKMSK